jgi:hypothetical protein
MIVVLITTSAPLNLGLLFLFLFACSSPRSMSLLLDKARDRLPWIRDHNIDSPESVITTLCCYYYLSWLCCRFHNTAFGSLCCCKCLCSLSSLSPCIDSTAALSSPRFPLHSSILVTHRRPIHHFLEWRSRKLNCSENHVVCRVVQIIVLGCVDVVNNTTDKHRGWRCICICIWHTRCHFIRDCIQVWLWRI